ncbi:MAG: guanosine-3',5'-bis(diphosphate) 3'-pyrophosphohydrolase, partial [Cardiobacteriales bacterium]
MDYTHSRYYNPALTGLTQITHSVDQLLKVITYLPENEQQQLVDCCFYAAEAHKADIRSSGEPFICHPIKVAEILAREVQFDLTVLQAGVLHDVVEDTAVSKSDITEIFGQEIADLVDGVTKLKKEKGMSRQELQAQTFKKLAIAMEEDPRVVMIKFADRVHNMQTISALKVDRQIAIAKETLEVYAPIAERLGMSVFKNTLEELAFRTLHPLRSKLINSFIDQTHARREDEFLAVQEKLTQIFQTVGINAHVRKRRRSACTIHNKMKAGKANKKSLQNAGLPLIVITETRDECYRVLGIIHELYKPIASKLKDYIALNKSNGYQSIHTTVLSKNRALNFQIRTRDMHTVAESGIIALWR